MVQPTSGATCAMSGTPPCQIADVQVHHAMGRLRVHVSIPFVLNGCDVSAEVLAGDTLQLEFAPHIRHASLKIPLPATPDHEACRVKFSRRRKALTFESSTTPPADPSSAAELDTYASTRVPETRCMDLGRAESSAPELFLEDQAIARNALYGLEDLPQIPPHAHVQAHSRREAGGIHPDTLKARSHGRECAGTRSCTRAAALVGERYTIECNSEATSATAQTVLEDCSTKEGEVKTTNAPAQAVVRACVTMESDSNMTRATGLATADDRSTTEEAHAVLQELHLQGSNNVPAPALEAVGMSESEEPVDLMNGQRTGGEHLPPVAAESTGASFDAAGIAAFLSTDRLAGSLPAEKVSQQKNAGSKKGKRVTRKRVEKVAAAASRVLTERSWAVIDNFVPREAILSIRKEMQVMENNYTPGEIWIGATNEVGAQIKKADVRGDVVLWLDDHALSAKQFIKDGKKTKCRFTTLRSVLATVDKFVTAMLSKRVKDLEKVRERSDAMMAIYPGHGARFARHIDNTAGDGRRLTVLCYLNPSWDAAHGGALRLWPPDGSNPVDVSPTCGRLAMFYSKTVPHGVQRTLSARHSVTLWYYDVEERAQSIAAAALATADMTRASHAEQAAARDLIQSIMVCDCSSEAQAVLDIRAQAASLSLASLEAVGRVLGVGGAAESGEVFAHLNLHTLQALQSRLGCMGMEHRPGQ